MMTERTTLTRPCLTNGAASVGPEMLTSWADSTLRRSTSAAPKSRTRRVLSLFALSRLFDTTILLTPRQIPANSRSKEVISGRFSAVSQ